MFKNYLTIAIRNLRKNKAHSFINIAGLSVGMAVALLIGLWIYDEISYDKYHANYNRIAGVMQQVTINGRVHTVGDIPLPLDAELRKSYGKDFEHIVMTAFTGNHILTVGEKKISYAGNFVGSEGPDMLSLHMLRGTRSGLVGPSGMLISTSVAKALFGDEDPMDKVISLDNKASFKVSGVYEDLPDNTTFHDMAFMAPWDFFVAASADFNGRNPTDWNDASLFMYVQVREHAGMQRLSAKIKNMILDHAGPGQVKLKPQLFLQPMSRWHLYSEFKDGVNTGGAIRYVWLFGIIGGFVLLLACINFMNLSTARSEKRAKEVGIRKSIGSLRGQLIGQFFTESIFMATLAFAFALLLVWLSLPFFNEVADKKILFPWSNILFWALTLAFVLFTGVVAGSYPALYLSAFRPVKVLKGRFNAGRWAALPRQVLVVLQFTVSVVLIIGTMVVFRQIEFAKDRPVGYTRDGLVYIETSTSDLHDHFSAFRADLLKSGAITEVAESNSPTTGVNYNRGDVTWPGKDPSMSADFGNIAVSTAYGKTVGWQFTAGRDFSPQLRTDSAGLVLNEAAVKYMGLKDPVGQIIRVGKFDLTVIGVVKDMVMGSPYEPVKQTLFRLGHGAFDYVDVRINPAVSTHEAIRTLEAVCKTYSPAVPFACKFVDEEYARKFSNEHRVGRLAGLFAALAIFISCLGLFGMASFMAEQRVKEIGIRKVMGASVVNLWALLSKDFLLMVAISIVIALPLGYNFMGNWLMHYPYHATMPWWVFAWAAAGALLITLLTVSYQGIKAAMMNPVRALRTE
ncbi:ABC transporter permease [Puia dinghuensis]|uniref:ABC transporter permease n=1 Tax=Puia dinghuensis TaxID=1792502 RepID=A0A8J2UJ61_9BACT|nr:ABC transporter permease [Puia dinghuensis]GGB24366.1 ABC transporter permease [Puia dinghuensis]